MQRIPDGSSMFTAFYMWTNVRAFHQENILCLIRSHIGIPGSTIKHLLH